MYFAVQISTYIYYQFERNFTMGDYVTSKRLVEFQYGGFASSNDTPTIPSTPLGLVNLEQSVTSFRSNDRKPFQSLTAQQILSDAGVGQGYKLAYPYDNGHTFDLIKRSTKCGTLYFRGPLYSWQGPCAIMSWYPDSDWLPTPNVDLDPYGALAIKRTIPTKPIVSIAEILAQLGTEQELPKLGIAGNGGIQKFSGQIRDSHSLTISNLKDLLTRFRLLSGEELLNIQFGWKPFLSDFQDILKAVLTSNDAVQQLIRDSGRNVRRRYSFPVETTVTVLDDNHVIDGALAVDTIGYTSQFGVSRCNVTATDTLTTRMWFSGAYTYHIPDGDSIAAKFARYAELADHVIGFSITPSVIWDLTPWSWLSDWFVDIGTIVSNASSLDQNGLVLRYGYLMCEQVRIRNVAATNVHSSNGHKMRDMYTTHRQVRKQRVRSTPFGFGLNPDSFTDYQWSILAALGLSSGKSTYHSPR
jgi:hypothetical protein